MDKSRRFTGRQITTMVVAASIAVIAAPVGALAATGSLINIADPSNPALVAHVDASGRLEVGDGSGALTVDGAIRPLPPATPWFAQLYITPTQTYDATVEGPTTSAINITSLSITVAGSGYGNYGIFAESLPATAKACVGSNGAPTGRSTSLWGAESVSAAVPAHASFPTALQYRPPSGMKACLFAAVSSASNTTQYANVSISGYYGA